MGLARVNVRSGGLIASPLPLLFPMDTALSFVLPLLQSLGIFIPLSIGCIFMFGFLESLRLLLHLKIPILVDISMMREDVALVVPLTTKPLIFFL